MNKLIILALFSACLIVINNGAEQVKENRIAEVDATILREVRSADPKKKDGKKNKERRKMKKNYKKGKTENKKGRKEQKPKSAKQLNKKKRNKKAQKGNKNRKFKKFNKKTKNGKKGRKNMEPVTKNKKLTGTRRVSQRAGTCMPETCIDTGVTYMKIMKDRVANFLSQKSRIEKYNQTSVNKAGKKGLFIPILNRLREAGGGNSSDLQCNGDSSSAGAKQFTNLTISLMKCEEEISSSCSANLPTIDMTELNICSEAVQAFSGLTKECQLKKGSEACTCWSSMALQSAGEAVKKCDLKQDNKKMTAAKKACTSAFGKCRKLEDEVSPAISACSPANTKSKVIEDIKQGLKNKLAATKLSTKITAAANVATRAAASLTCSSFIVMVREAARDMIRAPLLKSTETKLNLLVEATVETCSVDEKTRLLAASVEVDMAADAIDLHIDSKQANLLISTGTTVSISAVNATITSQSSTTSSPTMSPVTTTSSTKMSPVTTTRATHRRGRKMFKAANMKM